LNFTITGTPAAFASTIFKQHLFLNGGSVEELPTPVMATPSGFQSTGAYGPVTVVKDRYYFSYDTGGVQTGTGLIAQPGSITTRVPFGGGGIWASREAVFVNDTRNGAVGLSAYRPDLTGSPCRYFVADGLAGARAAVDRGGVAYYAFGGNTLPMK